MRLAPILLLALAAAGCDQPSQVQQRAPEAVATASAAAPSAGTVASADGVPIAFSATGAGDTALVLIHGWSCDQGYWAAQVPAFAPGYRVVTVDLAGHGKSGLGRTNWTIPAFGADVAAVVRALPQRRVILVGHSMGGPVALEAARLLGDRVIGVIGVDTLADLAGKTMSDEQMKQFAAQLRADPPGATRMVVEQFMFRKDADPALKARIVADMASAPPKAAIGAMEALLAYDPKPAAKALGVPIVAINADLVPPMDAAKARAVAPRFKLVTMPRTGHFLHMEDPARFNPLLRAEVELIAGG